MTVLQHLRHANEVTCFMSFEAHLHITQVTFIQEIMFFFWNSSLNTNLGMQGDTS